MLEGDDLRAFAQDELDRHTPANQENNGYERCALCHYTRHPCDVYDLAAAVLRLLDKNERLSEAYIEASNPGIDMDEVRKAREWRHENFPGISDPPWPGAKDAPGPGEPGDASDAT